MPQCQAAIYSGGYLNSKTGCSRKANAGGKFCTQHDPVWIKQKEEKRNKRREGNFANEERIRKFENAACLFVKRLAMGGKDIDDYVLRAQTICREHGIDYEE